MNNGSVKTKLLLMPKQKGKESVHFFVQRVLISDGWTLSNQRKNYICGLIFREINNGRIS